MMRAKYWFRDGWVGRVWSEWMCRRLETLLPSLWNAHTADTDDWSRLFYVDRMFREIKLPARKVSAPKIKRKLFLQQCRGKLIVSSWKVMKDSQVLFSSHPHPLPAKWTRKTSSPFVFFQHHLRTIVPTERTSSPFPFEWASSLKKEQVRAILPTRMKASRKT